MTQSKISRAELRDYLKKIPCKRRTVNQEALTPSEVNELETLSSSPPAHLTILKKGSRSTVGSLQLSSGRDVVLKYYVPKNIFKKINYAICGSRCNRSWRGGLGLTKIGFPTPIPLMQIERYTHAGLLNTKSFLATEKAAGIQLQKTPSERFLDLVDPLKAAFELLGYYNIAHGDLKATNIIVDDQNRISFIDLDATQFLLTGTKWTKARKYDQDRFRKNWRDIPEAARILNPCIDV